MKPLIQYFRTGFEYLNNNKDWIFSGVGVVVGVAVITAIWRAIRRRKEKQSAYPNISYLPEKGERSIEDEKESFKKGIQRALQRHDEWKEAEGWLINNKDVLIDNAVKDVVKKPEKYRGRGLYSSEETESFKDSIGEHVQWILECFSNLTSSLPLEDFLTIPINYRVRSVYRQVFISIHKQIKRTNKFKKQQLSQKAIDELLWFVEYLRDIY